MSDGRNSAAPTTAEIVGGVHNTTPISLQDGQAAGLQLTSDGSLKVSSSGGGGTQDVNIAEVAGSAPSLANPLPVELSNGSTQAGTASAPLRVDPTGTTPQPITASSLPLPTNAATSTKQSDGSQKTQVVDGSGNVVGSTGNALDVNIKSGITNPLPISGTVTANAGTNLNTSALALDATLTGGTQKTKVVDTGGTNALVVDSSGAASENLTKLGGTAIDTNSGNKSAGTQRVVLATDQPNLTSPLNQNLTQISGSAISTAASGVQKVGIVGNAGAIFDGATAASVPANAVQQGLRAATTYPTAVTDGQLVGTMADKAGRQVVAANGPRDLIGTSVVSNNSATSAASLIAAGATGVFNDIITLVITNRSATATVVSLTDGTTTYTFAIAGNGGLVCNFPTPLPAASTATAWTIGNSAAVAMDYMTVYVKNK